MSALHFSTPRSPCKYATGTHWPPFCGEPCTYVLYFVDDTWIRTQPTSCCARNGIPLLIIVLPFPYLLNALVRPVPWSCRLLQFYRPGRSRTRAANDHCNVSLSYQRWPLFIFKFLISEPYFVTRCATHIGRDNAVYVVRPRHVVFGFPLLLLLLLLLSFFSSTSRYYYSYAKLPIDRSIAGYIPRRYRSLEYKRQHTTATIRVQCCKRLKWNKLLLAIADHSSPTLSVHA